MKFIYLKIISFLFLLAPMSASLAQGVHYKVTIDAENPETAMVTMVLPRSNRSHVLYSRAGENQTVTQVRDVTCRGKIIKPSDDGRWRTPRNCDELNWVVDFALEDENGIAAYEQKSVLKKRGDWWVFSSPTALLRLRREPPNLTIHFDVPYQESFYAKIPTSSEPPAYFALGVVPSETIMRGKISLTTISDDPAYTSGILNVDDHLSALEYLSSIMGIEDNGEIREITMIMMGIVRERASLGGAAGKNAMVVNYIFENEKSREREKYFPILIAIHEQIHQLYDGKHMLWVSESLAHYYATKALRRIYEDNDAIKEIVEGLYTSPTDGMPGLVEIQRRIDEARDFEYYDNFYNQGSAFWYELDQLIYLASEKRETLDDYLAMIMHAEFKKGEGLPKKVLRQLDFVSVKAIRELETRYLFSELD